MRHAAFMISVTAPANQHEFIVADGFNAHHRSGVLQPPAPQVSVHIRAYTVLNYVLLSQTRLRGVGFTMICVCQ